MGMMGCSLRSPKSLQLRLVSAVSCINNAMCMDYRHHDVLLHATSYASKQTERKSEEAPETIEWEQVSHSPPCERRDSYALRSRFGSQAGGVTLAGKASPGVDPARPSRRARDVTLLGQQVAPAAASGRSC